MSENVSKELESSVAAIEAAFVRAAQKLDLEDATDENEHWELHEARYHCGVCTVRVVMEEVWPAVQSYIDFVVDQEKNCD